MPRGSNLEGKPGPGRPKGCPNKVTFELQEMIQRALLKAGGVKYLEEQARENPGAFLTLVAKLLPRDLHISGNVGVDLLVASLEAGRARLLAVRETQPLAKLPQPQDLREVEDDPRSGASWQASRRGVSEG